METVRVYVYSDSGPYGYWAECPPEWKKVAWSGFGETPIKEIPKELWDTYKEAVRLRDAAEHAIDKYVESLDA